ncbi:HMG box [Ancylostoma caninum]|uniref:HMG box n=1 Tax=Ancylostoma caninum TaxID=29170 RepID=A0A368GHM7_ANCCA|nr:HMG box [Ancylostoma caninum]
MSMRDIGKPPVRGKTSPYGFFVKMCYEEHKKKYPNENVQVTEISKKCSEKWKTMSDDEKRRFYELAQKDAERYQAEVAAYGGEDAMRKRKRAKKDPNAPKRALSAFFFFSQDRRPEVQQMHPEWKVGQVAQELGRMWKNVSMDEKDMYERKALADKERYAEVRKRCVTTRPQSLKFLDWSIWRTTIICTWFTLMNMICSKAKLFRQDVRMCAGTFGG